VRLFELKAKRREDIGDREGEELSQPIGGRHLEVPGRWRPGDQVLRISPIILMDFRRRKWIRYDNQHYMPMGTGAIKQESLNILGRRMQNK
jgi:hypothetical protein